MAFPHDGFEFVHVVPDFRLFDEDSYQHTYSRADGGLLEPGLYIVHWPSAVAKRRYDEWACFDGPFESLDQARASIKSMQMIAGEATRLQAKPLSHRFVVEWIVSA